MTLDRFYCTSETSYDGWPWTTSARAPDVVERQYPSIYGGRGLSFDVEGSNRSVNVSLPTVAERQKANPLTPSDPTLPDFYRFKEWERDFDSLYGGAGSGSAGSGRDLPSLTLVRLPNDHTGSFDTAIDGVKTPETQVADNDYALGLLVEKISKSRFADDMLIFVVEDDSQDGGASWDGCAREVTPRRSPLESPPSAGTRPYAPPVALPPILTTGFLTRFLPDGEERRLYQLYVPSDYTPARRWPVILFLHGAGEGGRDALLPTEYQLGSAIRRNAARFPGLVVFPQVQRKAGWSEADVGVAMDALASTEREFATDPDRVYLTGVSSGARAAWYALYRHPRRFAAALVVCGLVRQPLRNGVRTPDPYPVVPEADGDAVESLARRVRTTPVWTFHGDADPVFPVEDARQVMAALARERAPALYTELAGFGHDVWDVAYYSEEVADWLFAQSRAS